MKKLLEKYCNHLSSNLFFFYIFGKLVEEEEGNFILWLSYNFTGATANSVSCVGASGAVFGLFAISDWWKILEVLILANLLKPKLQPECRALLLVAIQCRVSITLQFYLVLSLVYFWFGFSVQFLLNLFKIRRRIFTRKDKTL
ncbi:Rhomboid-like protein 11 [Citrus sinensis]|uniref:Rhomboid-like protein 11 n=1 Tax=Citrus sinensis TaxID=2711 RepID=A0ACB8L5X1_CITSI|nr:Rhomboid-like protein 11 [Citrus sinensis]